MRFSGMPRDFVAMIVYRCIVVPDCVFHFICIHTRSYVVFVIDGLYHNHHHYPVIFLIITLQGWGLGVREQSFLLHDRRSSLLVSSILREWMQKTSSLGKWKFHTANENIYLKNTQCIRGIQMYIIITAILWSNIATYSLYFKLYISIQ